MNSHQRRKAVRELHMELPVGRMAALVGGNHVFLHTNTDEDIVLETKNAPLVKIYRHPRDYALVDVLVTIDGKERCVSVHRKNLKLIGQPDDRPWWGGRNVK